MECLNLCSPWQAPYLNRDVYHNEDVDDDDASLIIRTRSIVWQEHQAAALAIKMEGNSLFIYGSAAKLKEFPIPSYANVGCRAKG